MIGDRGSRRRRGLLVVFLSMAVAFPLAAPVTAASLQPYQVIAVPSEADAVRVGDVTGDGRADVVFTTGYVYGDPDNFTLFVLPQLADGTLGALVRYPTAGSYTHQPGSLDLGDMTGDGRADVVVGLDRYGIQVFPGQADGTLGAPTFTTTTDSTRVAIGNLDDNPGLDVAGIGWGSNTVSVFSGGAAALTLVETDAARHAGYDDLEIGDVSGDGLDDLIVMSGQLYADPNLSILTRIPGGGFTAAAEYSIGSNILTHGIGVGDVTGDGLADVVASYGGNQPSSFIAVFAQTAGGALASPVSYTSYDIPEPVEVAELDGDGRNDVVTLHGGWNQAGIYRGRSNGTLAAETLEPIPYASSYNPQGLAVGDVDGNGMPDIVAADYNHGIVILRNGAPAPTVPDAPTLTSATPGNGAVQLVWSAPASDGGSPITSYTANASPGDGTCVVASLGCTIDGLSNGTTYTFTVHATNAVGAGPESDPLTGTPRTVPSAPQNLTAKSKGSRITLAWALPSSDGGTPVTDFRIYRGGSSTTGSVIATVGADTLTFIDATAPRKATTYYWVTAVNAAGEGPRSNVASASGH